MCSVSLFCVPFFTTIIYPPMSEQQFCLYVVEMFYSALNRNESEIRARQWLKCLKKHYLKYKININECSLPSALELNRYRWNCCGRQWEYCDLF